MFPARSRWCHGSLVAAMVCGMLLGGLARAEEQRIRLVYAPAPIDNPLQGLVPYAADVRRRFPHSMEFFYLPLSACVMGPDKYDWRKMEGQLDAIADRGHQAIFRVYLEYPGRTGAIPDFLLQDGLRVHRYQNNNTAPRPAATVETPDYANRKLRQTLRRFIAALGKKYDGDPRIGFVTAGLLGTWGEWHTHPRGELFADKTVQREVMDAYAASFRTTPILLRYPAGDDDPAYAANHQRPFGYHDDSFAWATLATGQAADGWFFLARLSRAGEAATDKWKRYPIGGEIRPEAWKSVFIESARDGRIQNFDACVAATHASWLMDSGLFREQPSSLLRSQAEQHVRKLGYEFHVAAVGLKKLPPRSLELRIEIENRGVAPFYYDWPIELALFNSQGRLVRSSPGHGKLIGLLPGEASRVWQETIDCEGLAAGEFRVLLRAANPLAGGHPLRFANRSQDADHSGWLTLGQIHWKP